jgi:hypothetical protein
MGGMGGLFHQSDLAGTTRFSRRISAGFRVCARLAARLKYPPIASHPPTIEKVSFRFCFIFLTKWSNLTLDSESSKC